MEEQGKAAPAANTEATAPLRQEIERAVRSELAANKAEFERIRANNFAFVGGVAVLVTIALLLWALFFVRELGYVEFGPITSRDRSDAAEVSVADIVGVFIPALITIVAFFIGATGLKRLGLYDEEFRNNRRERREENLQTLAEIDRRFSQYSERFAERVEAFEADITQLEEGIEKTASEIATRKAEEQAGDLLGKIQEIEIDAGKLAENLSTLASNYGWMLRSDNADRFKEGAISSVGELHKTITQIFSDKKDADAKTLVEQYFPKSGGSPLRGTPDDFFNTATQLSRSDLEPLAWRVLEVGLSLFPNNADMLATGMKHALDAGFPEKARELYDRAAKLLPEQKNWRLWVFMGSYLEDAASEDEVHRFYKDYIDRFIDSQGELREPAPNDAMEERVLAKFAAYLVKMARRREAKDVCLLAADHIARVPQCAANLADIYLEEGEYDNAIKFSEKALRDDRRVQLHASAAARHLTIGLAKDARLQSNTPESLNALRKDLRDVFSSYGAVLRSGRNIPAYTFSIREQVNSVISFAETHGLDREQIIACMGPELRALINLAVDDTDGTKSSATQSGDNGFSLKEILLAAKTISELDEGNRSEPLSRLVEQLRGLDQTEQIKVLLTQAAEHFANDPDEAKFVAVLREIASRL